MKESWPVEAHPRVDVDTLVQEAVDSGLPRVVVTGGEPAMHDLGPLTAALQDAGLATHLETSGTHPVTTTRGNPESTASWTNVSTSTRGWASTGQLSFTSHHEHPTSHPPNRMNHDAWPVHAPSP